jgi:hypothetical protein
MSQAIGPFCSCMPSPLPTVLLLGLFRTYKPEEPNPTQHVCSMVAVHIKTVGEGGGEILDDATVRSGSRASAAILLGFQAFLTSVFKAHLPAVLPFLPKTLEWYWLISWSNQLPEPWENTVVLECRHLHSLARTSYDMTWDGRGGRVTADETTSDICLMLCEILPVCWC